MKYQKQLILILLSVIISSCTTVKLPSKEIQNNVTMIENEGMVIGAISIDKKYFVNGFYMYFATDGETDTSKYEAIIIIPPQGFTARYEPDMFDGNKAVHYFKIKKQSGNYKFFAKTQAYRSASGTTYLTKPLEFPFTIEKNKIKYIGEFYFQKESSYEPTDKSDRDLPKLKEMFPALVIKE